MKDSIRSLGFVVLGALLVLIIGHVFAADQYSPATQGGRYQLFQGYFKFVNQGGATDEKGVFLLDTATGQVKRYYLNMTRTGTVKEGWETTERTTDSGAPVIGLPGH